MSQNTPPGQGPDDRRDVPPPPPAGAAGNESAPNPYFTRQAQTEPDLDAGAPRLRTVEERRLDRKALLFLGGILLLVLAMGFLLLRRNSDNEPAPPPRLEARTSTPDLPSIPTATPVTPPADPIPMLPSQDVPVSYRPELPSASDDRRREPTLLERRIAAAQAEGGQQNPTTPQYPYPPGFPGQPGAQQQQGQGQGGAGAGDVATSATFIRKPDALLVRGTYLRCVLETRVITDVPGYTSCLLTESVYSINGRTLLLPKGSKIYGSYNGGPVAKRVDVIWDRITTPNGIDVAMSSPGTDGLGGAGVPGQFSAHWPQRIASALMISLISDAFKYAAAENGPETTTVNASGWAVQSPYESATARTMERLANQALEQQRPPTVTVNQGTVMNVYVAKDVDFSAVLGGGGR